MVEVRLTDIPEAAWVTEMRKHFFDHGYYRQEDLNRLLGNPGQSATIDPETGRLVIRDPR